MHLLRGSCFRKRLCSQQGIYSLCWRHTGFGMWLWRWQRTSHTLKSQYLTISIFDLVVNAQHTGEGAVNKLRYWNEFGVPVTINKWTPNSTAGWCGLLDWILLSTLALRTRGWPHCGSSTVRWGVWFLTGWTSYRHYLYHECITQLLVLSRQLTPTPCGMANSKFPAIHL